MRLGVPTRRRHPGLTVRPVLQHSRTPQFLKVLMRKFTEISFRGSQAWMRADLGVTAYFAEVGIAVTAAPRMLEAQVAVSAIGADPRERPPDGGYRDCDLGTMAFPVLTATEINALPEADQRRQRNKAERTRRKREEMLTTEAGRRAKADAWRAAIQENAYQYVQQKEHRVVCEIFVGMQRFLSGPRTLAGAVQIRDRFIDAFEAGWTLTALQQDLRTTFKGHEGVGHTSKDERTREALRLKQIFDQAKQGPGRRAAAPKAKVRPKAEPKQRAQAKAAAPKRIAKAKAKAKQRPQARGARGAPE